MDATIITLALAAATVVKIVVDLVKLGVDAPRVLPPLLALILGPIIVVLMTMAQATPLTQAVLAADLLAGLIAAGVAMGVTSLGDHAKTALQLRRARGPRPIVSPPAH